MAKKKGVLYSVLFVSGLGLLSKVLGLLREGVFSYYLGTSADADDFFLAYGFFSNVTMLIGLSIGIAYLPYFIKDNVEKDEKTALANCSILMNQIFIFLTIVSAFIFIFPNLISIIVAPTFDNGRREVLSEYFRWFAVILFAMVAVNIYASVFDAQKRFGISRMIGMSYSVFSIIILILFYNKIYTTAFLISVIISALVQYGISVIFLYRKQPYHWRIRSLSGYTKEVYKQTFPVFIGTGTLYVSQLIDRTVASTLAIGSVSALNYSGTLHSVINTLLTASVVAVFYTDFSEKFIHRNIDGMMATLNKGIMILTMLLVPISIFCIVNSIDIIRFLLQRGAFSSESVTLTAIAFAFYLLGTPFYGIRNLLSRLFYAVHDTRTPMINGIITIIINIVLCLVFVFVFHMNVKGITFAASITAVISTVVLLMSLHKRGYHLRYKLLMNSLIQILIAVSIAAIVNLFVLETLKNFYLFWRLLIVFSLFCLSYCLVLTIIRNKEILALNAVIIQHLKSKIFHKKS